MLVFLFDLALANAIGKSYRITKTGYRYFAFSCRLVLENISFMTEIRECPRNIL